jgi:hypothetical protein
MTGVLIRKQACEDTECDLMMKAEIRIIQLPNKEHHQYLPMWETRICLPQI